MLIADSGFDAAVMFEDCLSNKYRFGSCIVGKHHFLRFSGGFEKSGDGHWTPIQSRSLDEQIPTPHYFSTVVKHHGKLIFRRSQLRWVKVRLPGWQEEDLTLVVSRIAGGEDMPPMLLTNLTVENVDDAKRILRYYLRSLECEEATRFHKSQVHLEKTELFAGLQYVGWCCWLHW